MGINFGTKVPDGGDAAPNESNPGANVIGDPPAENSAEATAAKLAQGENNKPVDDSELYESGIKPSPSVSDLGIDVEKVQDESPERGVLAHVAAAAAGVGKTDDVVYSSHPIQVMQIGPYEFRDTILRLKADQVDTFDKLLEGLPPQDRLTIRKLDTSKAEEIVQTRLDMTRQATRDFDSSVGRTAMEQMRAANPVIGTQDLESMNKPAPGFVQGGGNQPAAVETKSDAE